MTKLTKSQREFLTQANDAGPDGVERDPAAEKVFTGLIKRGLLLSLPRTDGPSRIVVTDAGRVAIAPKAAPQAPASKARPKAMTPTTVPVTAIPTGKIGILIALLQQPQGADIAAMMAATGWQAHSVRGAIAGSIKKRHGLAVSSEKTVAGRVYRIVEVTA